MHETRKHWHPLINAAILTGGIKPAKDSLTGRLADEYQAFRYMPGLLNKKGLALDEMARVIIEEYPETASHIDTDCFDGNIYPEDFRYALECALQSDRPEDLEQFAPYEADFNHLDGINLDYSFTLSDFYHYALCLGDLR